MYEEIQAAAQWWADALRQGPGIQNAGFRDADETRISLALTLLSATKPPPVYTMIQAFEEELFIAIQERIGTNWYPDDPKRGGALSGRIIATNYGVSKEHPLGVALMKAGIIRNNGPDDSRLPMQTIMQIDPGCVSVACGYGAPFEVIWSGVKDVSPGNEAE